MGSRDCLLWDRRHAMLGNSRPARPLELSSSTMAIGTFYILTSKGRPKVVKTGDGTDVAARYFVYKLYETTGGQPMQ